jgi:hypothetical protein
MFISDKNNNVWVQILGTPDAALVAKFKKFGSTHVDWGFSQWPARPDAIPKMLIHSTKEAIDLVQQMLAYDPEKRITAKDALRHPWFADLREAERKAKEQADLVKPGVEGVSPANSTESVSAQPVISMPSVIDPLTGKEAQPVDSKYRQQPSAKLTTSPLRIPLGVAAGPKDMSPQQVAAANFSPQGKDGPTTGRNSKSPAPLVPLPQQPGPPGTKPAGPSGAILESGAILFNNSNDKSPAQKAFVKAQGSIEYMSARDRAVQQYVLRPPGGKETAVPQTIPKAVLSPLLGPTATAASSGSNVLSPQQLAWHPKPSVLSPLSSNAQVRLNRPKPALSLMHKEPAVPLQLTPIPVSGRSPVDVQLGSPSALASQFTKMPPSMKMVPSPISHAFVSPQPSLQGKRPGQDMRLESFSERHLPLDRSKLAPIGGGVPQSSSSQSKANALIANVKATGVTRESSIAAALVRAGDYRPKLDALPPPLMSHHDVHYGRPHEPVIPKGSGYLEHMKRRQQQYVSPYSQKTGANGLVLHPGRRE